MLQIEKQGYFDYVMNLPTSTVIASVPGAGRSEASKTQKGDNKQAPLCSASPVYLEWDGCVSQGTVVPCI